MYGPSARELVGFCLLLLVVGGVLGVGCQHGCAYVRRHIVVHWLHN